MYKRQGLGHRDAYAEEVGFVSGFPVGSDSDKAWLTHCYGMLGVARDTAPDSGNASGLYMVIGHSPRHLDRNVTLVGRALVGMEYLAALPRGTGPLGFYTEESAQLKIDSIVAVSDLLVSAQEWEVLRTDSATFTEYIRARANRTEDWFVTSGGRIELCNAMPPVRRVE